MRSAKKDEPAAPRASTRSNGESTRRRILEAAEILFADQGLRATSLRAIARAADVRQPTLHYHFRDKRELFRATLELHALPVIRARLERLDALEASGQGTDLEGILSAAQRPNIEALGRELAPGVTVVTLLHRAIVDADPEWDEVFGDLILPIRNRFLAAFQRALPELDPDELRERLNFIQGALAGLYLDRSNHDLSRSWRHLRAHPDAFEARVVALCASTLRAPSLGPPPDPAGHDSGSTNSGSTDSSPASERTS